MDPSSDDVVAALSYRLQADGPGDFPTEVCVVKKGPRAYKSASLLRFGDRESGEVRHRKLHVQTWGARTDGTGGFDFTTTKQSWSCEDGEIDALHAFLSGALDTDGVYRLVRSGSQVDRILEEVASGSIPLDRVVAVVAAAARTPDVVEALAGSSDGLLLSEAVELQRRRGQLDALQELVSDPTRTEHDIHKQLKSMGWVFGGQYVGEAARRQLTTDGTLDIPLLRPDRSLHIVELKKANIPALVHAGRGGYFNVGSDVNHAVGQAMNYLTSADEERYTILGKFKIEARRASATVVIGHPRYVTSATAAEVAEAIRTYNSHLSRIQVMHYGDLIAAAQVALALSTPVREPDADDDASPTPPLPADPLDYDEPPF